MRGVLEAGSTRHSKPVTHSNPISPDGSTRSKGGGPAWLVGVAGDAIEYIEGADLVKTIEAPLAYGGMTHPFCTNCASHIYQNPKGSAPTRGLLSNLRHHLGTR